MRTRKARKTALVVAATGALFLGAVQTQAADIVGTGGATSITMTLTPGSGPPPEAVVGTLNDLVFGPGVTIPEIVDPGSTLSAAITATDGTIPLVDASNLPDFGIVVIDGERIAYQGKDENDLEVATDGQEPPVVTGRGQDGTTAADHASGATVGVPTALPNCTMSAALDDADKNAVFSFLPEDCIPGTDCTGVRGIVIALDNLSELTSPIELYTCTTEGEGELTCPDDADSPADPFQPAQSSRSPTEEGNDLLPTTCEGATVGGGGCIGDCGAPLGEVALGEVQRSFNIFLGQPLSNCPAADGPDENMEVSLGEVQMAFNNFLNGCPVP